MHNHLWVKELSREAAAENSQGRKPPETGRIPCYSAPKGRQCACRPFGALGCTSTYPFQGLTPLAIIYRPFGTNGFQGYDLP